MIARRGEERDTDGADTHADELAQYVAAVPAKEEHPISGCDAAADPGVRGRSGCRFIARSSFRSGFG